MDCSHLKTFGPVVGHTIKPQEALGVPNSGVKSWTIILKKLERAEKD